MAVKGLAVQTFGGGSREVLSFAQPLLLHLGKNLKLCVGGRWRPGSSLLTQGSSSGHCECHSFDETPAPHWSISRPRTRAGLVPKALQGWVCWAVSVVPVTLDVV